MTVQLPIVVDPRFAEAAVYLNPGASAITSFSLARYDDGLTLTAWNLPGDPPDAAQVTAALLAIDWATLRQTRNGMLFGADWITIRQQEQIGAAVTLTLTAEKYSAILAWKQQLRDAPATAVAAGIAPGEIVFPAMPAL
jgi:hypothetical protein